MGRVKVLITLLLPAFLSACLVSFAAGIAVLLKANNQLTGWLSVAVDLVFALLSWAIFLMVSIPPSVQIASGMYIIVNFGKTTSERISMQLTQRPM